jgi:hypothetical protein
MRRAPRVSNPFFGRDFPFLEQVSRRTFHAAGCFSLWVRLAHAP